jgi:hypothetical protein
MDAIAIPSQIPANLSHRVLITSQNAREMAERSHIARRAKLEKLQADSEALRNVTPQSERLAEILKGIEDDLLKTKDYKKRNALASAYDKLFSKWQVLTGTPNPGARRGKGNQRDQPPIAQPIESPAEARTDEPNG